MNVRKLVTPVHWSGIATRKEKHARLRMVVGTIAIVASFAIVGYNPASAQSNDGPQQGEDVVEEIVVTGSHIRRDTFTSSAPLSVVDTEMIEGVGSTNLGDLLNRLPAIVSDVSGSSDNVVSPTDSGIHTTALRNLGSSRTLVLVNGRRYVSGMSASSGYGVDLNMLPTSMIERIEVLTGGQSAVYGSDAIAGVVNIITRQDFDGVELELQRSSASGDRRKTDVSLTLGKNFGGHNAWAAFGYSDDEGLLSRERDFSEASQWSIDTDGDGLRDTLDFLGSGFIPETRLIGGGIDIKGDGSPFNPSEDPLNFNEFRSLLLPLERRFAAAGLRLDMSERATATVELNYAQTESLAAIEPLPLRVPRDVFFVPEGGTTGIDLRTHPLFAGSSAGEQLVAAGVTSLDDVTTFERVVELGQIETGNIRTNFRAAIAFDYLFENGMALDVYGTYGVTEQNQTNTGDINVERAAAALNIEPDGFGGFQCADELARLQGCVPYNPFDTVDSVAGQAGITGYSPEAIDYLSAEGGIIGRVEQVVVSSVLSGRVPLELTEAGMPSFAVGLEYREERGTETPDVLRQKGIARQLQLKPTDGRFDVTELFGELQVPVLDWLDVDLAARFGDYSSVGNVSSWRLGLNAPISDSLRLRGTLATAVRAPNVSDLFAGAINNVTLLFDPCNGIDSTTTGNVAENCRSIPAIQQRINETGAFTLTQVETQQTDSFSRGSPTVQEEEADSFTLGLVLTPEMMPNFSLALDYYNIEIDDVIRVPSGTTILDRCYEVAPGEFDPTCGGLVKRDVNRGALLEVFTITNNEDRIETSGVDLEASYMVEEIGPGTLTLTGIANFLTKFDVVGSGGDVQDFKGEVLYPEVKAVLNLNYLVGDLEVFGQVRYRSETNDRNDNDVHNDNLNTIDSATYLDLRGSYRFNDTLRGYVGINNVFDSEPPAMGFSHKYFQQAINSNGTAFDIVGRQIFVGIEATF